MRGPLDSTPLVGLVMVLLLLCLVGLTVRDYRRWRIIGEKQVEHHVLPEALSNIVFGIMWLILGSLLAVQYALLGYLVAGLAGGGGAGILFAVSKCKSWEGILKREGHLSVEVQSRTLLGSGGIFVLGTLIGLVVLLSLIHAASAFPGGRLIVCQVGMGSFGGFFVGWGFYTWLWGKLKERQGFKPLVISMKRAGNT